MSTLGIFGQLIQPGWCQASCSALLCIPLARPEGESCRLGNPGPSHISPTHAPLRVSLHSRLAVTTHDGRQQVRVISYKSISIDVEKRTPRVAFDCGIADRISLTATARLKPGSPRSVKMVSHHGPPSSLGAWSLTSGLHYCTKHNKDKC